MRFRIESELQDAHSAFDPLYNLQKSNQAASNAGSSVMISIISIKSSPPPNIIIRSYLWENENNWAIEIHEFVATYAPRPCPPSSTICAVSAFQPTAAPLPVNSPNWNPPISLYHTAELFASMVKVIHTIPVLMRSLQ